MCSFSVKRSYQTLSFRRALLWAAVLGFAVGGADAEDHFWSSMNGGSFNYWLNWVPQWVPQEDDRAIFELGMDPAYEVTFYESATTDECLFRTDKVIMNLGGFTYTLDHPGFALIVGDDAGHVADVLCYNGTIDTTVTHVGLWEGSAGTLNLESGLILNVSDHLLVGNDGNAVMNIHDGASVITEYAATGGHDFGGNTGVLNVEGANAELAVNETLRVGVEGTGYMNLRNGASVLATRGYIGDAPSGYGELYITLGAELTMDEWLMAGGFGEGRLEIREAGKLVLGDLSIGGEAGGDGRVDLFHDGSRIDASQLIFVGDRGAGTMNVSQQATVTAAELRVGAAGSAVGEMSVSDAGTTVTVQNNLMCGHFGVGALYITDQADVRTTAPAGWIKIGDREGSDGYVLVDGGSKLTAEGAPLVLAGLGHGAVDILGGSEVHTSGELFMGWEEGGVGQLTISGAGSKYISDSGYPARIGDRGQGTLIIEDGGYFEKPGAFFIGIKESGVGAVVLNSNESAFKCEQLSVGEQGVGTFDINDGRVALGDVDPADVPAGEMHLAGDYAQLTGTGTVTGNVVNVAARVMPGGDEAAALTGVLTIDGDYVAQADSTLEIKIKGPLAGEQHSVLNVTGTATLDGTLQVDLLDGYYPTVGQQWVILTAGNVSGCFPTVTGFGEYSVACTANEVTITLVAPPVCRGDANCDGLRDTTDVGYFVAGLRGEAAWQDYCQNQGLPPSGCTHLNCDANGDGRVSFADIKPFMSLLGTPCP